MSDFNEVVYIASLREDLFFPLVATCQANIAQLGLGNRVDVRGEGIKPFPFYLYPLKFPWRNAKVTYYSSFDLHEVES